jgi:hypothetical protein
MSSQAQIEANRPNSRGAGFSPMSLGFVSMGQSALIVGRTPWSAADALVGLPWADDADSVGEKRVQGDPRGPGGSAPQFVQDSQS